MNTDGHGLGNANGTLIGANLQTADRVGRGEGLLSRRVGEDLWGDSLQGVYACLVECVGSRTLHLFVGIRKERQQSGARCVRWVHEVEQQCPASGQPQPRPGIFQATSEGRHHKSWLDLQLTERGSGHGGKQYIFVSEELYEFRNEWTSVGSLRGYAVNDEDAMWISKQLWPPLGSGLKKIKEKRGRSVLSASPFSLSAVFLSAFGLTMPV